MTESSLLEGGRDRLGETGRRDDELEEVSVMPSRRGVDALEQRFLVLETERVRDSQETRPIPVQSNESAQTI